MLSHFNSLLTAFIIMYSIAVISSQKSVCKQQTECSCQMDDGRVIDITSVGNSDGTPLFKDVMSSDGYLYSYNPCRGFSEGVCDNAAHCKKDPNSGETLAIGRAVGAQFSYDEQTGEIVIIYTAGQLGELHTFTYLLCSSKSGPAQFYPNGTMDANLFLTTLFSVCACPGACDANGVITNGSSSTFSIAYIVLICIALVPILYFAVGAAVMKFVKKASGTDIIPNKTFWASLPSNCKGLFNRCRGKNENYSDMK